MICVLLFSPPIVALELLVIRVRPEDLAPAP